MPAALHAFAESGSREYLHLSTTVRAPLAVSRRVGVLGIGHGVGTSLVAGRMAAALASRRGGRVLLVDGGDGTAGGYAGGREPADGSVSRGPAADASAPAFEHIAPATAAAWWARLADRQRAFDLSITDWGALPDADVADIAAVSHLVCVVASGDRIAIQHAATLVATLIEHERTAALLVVTAGEPGRGRALHEIAKRAPVPAVALPHDAGLADPTRPLRNLRSTTSLALLRLGGAVVGAVRDERERTRA